MTLHGAIAQVLQDRNRPLTANEIAREINSQNLYQRGDRDPIPPSQIHARVNKRPQLFYKEKVAQGNDLIGLKEWQNRSDCKTKPKDLSKYAPKPQKSNLEAGEIKRDLADASLAETTRSNFRPGKIKVLFVGESPPAGGTFFYYGNSNLARYTKEAFEAAIECTFQNMNAFLNFFMKKGCYLDDLCLAPVNSMDKTQRRTERQRGREPLAKRLIINDPAAVVVVMVGIEQDIIAALHKAGKASLPRYVLPFPAMSHQNGYVNGLTIVLRKLQADGLLENE